MISIVPNTANQVPASVASTVTEETGVAVSTMPAMRLTIPKNTHQP